MPQSQAYTLIKNLPGQYNRKLFYCSSSNPDDFPKIINKVDIAPGSELTVIHTGERYILSSDYIWILAPGGGSGPVNPLDLISGDPGNVIIGGSDSKLFSPASPVELSTDAENLLTFGSDGKLYGGQFLKSKVYVPGNLILYQAKLYKNKTQTTAGSAFVPSQWIDISASLVTDGGEVL